MEVGESRVTNLILRMLGPSVRSEIDDYVNDVCSRDFMVMGSKEQVENIFRDSISNFLDSLSQDELLDLRTYTGYNYKNINAILRNNWSYDVNGALTEEKRVEFKKLAEKIDEILSKFIMPQVNLVAFRGTTLDSFSSYGISDISQLSSLGGKFLYEPAFTSTSILEGTSYYNKKLDDGRFCNVGIRYLIPSESNDGALLFNEDTSYAVTQNEFLLNKGSLSKVIDVKIDEQSRTAVLTLVLVPKKVYEKKQDRSRTGV